MNTPFPARVHVIFARQSHSAIIIRRGPSKWSATFAWDRATDEITLGQWVHARIYERRCDLSPDGKHLIYFAMHGHWQSDSKGSWSAISRAPYLKAIGFWPKGDCWHGGGLFIDNKKFWLNGVYSGEGVRLPPDLQMAKEPPFEHYWGGECTGVYYPHLERAGWKFIGYEVNPKNQWDGHSVFEKPTLDGWTIIKTARETIEHPVGKGCYFDEHQLRHTSGKTVDGSAWSWCDWDTARKRLIWVTDGSLYSATLTPEGLAKETLIHDFNPYVFEPVAAPY